MTFKQYIKEEYFKTSKSGYAIRSGATDIAKNVVVEIWKNPTPSEISKYDELRLVLWKKDLYAWQSDTEKGWIEHRFAMRDIGVNDKKYITMTYSKRHGLEIAWYEMDNGSAYGGMITAKRGIIKQVVETNPNVIKAFGKVKLGNIGKDWEG